MQRARLLTVALSALLAGAAAALLLTRPAPLIEFAALRDAWVPSDAWLEDRHGEVLDSRRLDPGVRRLQWVALADVSPALVDAIVQGEDRRFARHGGVDWRAALGAARDSLAGRRRGASTISMQVASLVDRDAARTRGGRGGRGFAQKLRQMRLALQLERQWSKPQILEAYLNLLQFRGELQGIDAAAQLLAGKTPAGLTRDEARVLAALLPHPSARPARVARRACARLAAGETREAACAALEATASQLLARQRRVASGARLAPHLATQLLRAPGERIRTTLDASLQRAAQDVVARHLAGLEGRNVRDGAALVIDNATGDVLAYVGSAGALSTAPAVDGVRARRQAGSTLKPFLYALAFERRYLTAASLLDDSPVSIDTPNGIYLPRDYDHRYRGLVSARTALASSLNVPAVRALMLVGVEDFRDRLNDAGFSGIDREGAYYGFALALGSAEVSLWEQAMAYRTLALHGRSGALRLRLDEPVAALQEVTSPAAAFVAGDVLSDGAARTVTFGLDSSLATPYWAAVKTGTSKDMRDNWCVGFTRDHTVAVWVGNFEGDSMHDVSGVSGAAPAWRELMDLLHADGAPPAPAPPPGVASRPLRFANGLEPPRSEWYLDGTAPGEVVRPVDAAARLVRISSPVDGMVIALDPDIPVELQRVPLIAEGARAGHVLLVDGAPVGAARSQILWRPTRGEHRVALMDDAGRELHGLRFTVR